MIVCLRAAAQAFRSDATKCLRQRIPTDLHLGALEATEALRWWIRVGVTDALDDMPHNRFADRLTADGDERDAPNASESMRQSSQARIRSARASRRPRAEAARRRGDFGSRAGASGDRSGNAAIRLGGIRWLRAQADGHATCVLGRRPWLTGHVRRRGPGGGGRSHRASIRRKSGAIAGSHAERDRTDRQKVYIANVVPWRPPGNRTPTPQETQMCLPFIERQIHLADPEYLVCLGGSATRTILGVQSGIMRARGSWFVYPRQVGREIPALAMLHPAFLLRQPAHKRFAWADMRALAGALQR